MDMDMDMDNAKMPLWQKACLNDVGKPHKHPGLLMPILVQNSRPPAVSLYFPQCSAVLAVFDLSRPSAGWVLSFAVWRACGCNALALLQPLPCLSPVPGLIF